MTEDSKEINDKLTYIINKIDNIIILKYEDIKKNETLYKLFKNVNKAYPESSFKNLNISAFEQNEKTEDTDSVSLSDSILNDIHLSNSNTISNAEHSQVNLREPNPKTIDMKREITICHHLYSIEELLKLLADDETLPHEIPKISNSNSIASTSKETVQETNIKDNSFQFSSKLKEILIKKAYPQLEEENFNILLKLLRILKMLKGLLDEQKLLDYKNDNCKKQEVKMKEDLVERRKSIFSMSMISNKGYKAVPRKSITNINDLPNFKANFFLNNPQIRKRNTLCACELKNNLQKLNKKLGLKKTTKKERTMTSKKGKYNISNFSSNQKEDEFQQDRKCKIPMFGDISNIKVNQEDEKIEEGEGISYFGGKVITPITEDINLDNSNEIEESISNNDYDDEEEESNSSDCQISEIVNSSIWTTHYFDEESKQ